MDRHVQENYGGGCICSLAYCIISGPYAGGHNIRSYVEHLVDFEEIVATIYFNSLRMVWLSVV
jgi:hypothetical protein